MKDTKNTMHWNYVAYFTSKIKNKTIDTEVVQYYE